MVKALEKFNLDNLESLNKAQVELSNMLLKFFDQLPDQQSIESAINAALQSFFSKPLSLNFNNIQFKSTNDVLLDTNEYQAFFSQIALPPSAENIILEVENSLFKSLVYAILGTDPSENIMTAKPSDVERGIFSFILLKILAQIFQTIGADLPGKLQLVDSSSNFNDLKGVLKTSANVAIVNSNIRFGTQSSYIKLLIPESVLRNYLATPQESTLTKSDKLGLALRRATGIKTPIRTHVGTISLSDDEIKNLDIDDIILLDQSTVKLDEDANSLNGTVESNIGDPDFGILKSQISVSPQGHYTVKIKDFATHMASNIKPYRKEEKGSA